MFRPGQALEDDREPGKALRAARDILKDQPPSSAGWLAVWPLSDRVGDYALAAEAGRRAVELCEKANQLRAAE